MRVIFMGTPDFAVPSLEKLLRHGHEVCAVYTQPDKPKGRATSSSRRLSRSWPCSTTSPCSSR